MMKEAVIQFCERIDSAINTIINNSNSSVDNIIDQLCSNICFWDSNSEISRKYLLPLKGKKSEEVIAGLEYIKTMYSKKGDPTFHRW